VFTDRHLSCRPASKRTAAAIRSLPVSQALCQCGKGRRKPFGGVGWRPMKKIRRRPRGRRYVAIPNDGSVRFPNRLLS
jgi:hypothetical protein